MLKGLFSSKKKQPSQRQLQHPGQLMVGDIIALKYRESLPKELQEKQLEVARIGTYEYASGVSREVVLKDEHNQLFFMSVENDDASESLCFSKKIIRQEVFALFGEDSFADLWSDEWAELSIMEEIEGFDGWITERYTQTVKEQEAYFYDRDCHKADLAHARDGEELRYHECEGDDDRFGINVEVYGDGTTDIFLQVYCPIDVIEEMWPHGD